MPDRELINAKLADLESYYYELAPLLEEEARSLIENHVKLRAVERLFQLIVDTAIDINTHIIIESAFQPPDDYQSTFVTLGAERILPQEFALRIAPSVGLRNLVVHKYGRVDIKRMIADIKIGIAQYVEYMGYIKNFTGD